MVKIQFTVLAVDPGSMKCGLAVVTSEMYILHQLVTNLQDLAGTVTKLYALYHFTVIVIGDGTNSKKIRSSLLTLLNLPIIMINETKSSIEGRYRYLKENSKGLSRLLPLGLRIPRESYDDYVAVVLAERFLKKYPNFSPDKPIS